jgi:hypothetical protein
MLQLNLLMSKLKLSEHNLEGGETDRFSFLDSLIFLPNYSNPTTFTIDPFFD